ncbi:Spectrin beta chain, non-erythrocytic 5 [Sparganum proliferum]
MFREFSSILGAPEQSVYNDEAVAADNKLYQNMHEKANRTEAMLASLKAQVAHQTECDSWFQMAADSLEWIREMQASVDETYDWRVTLRRFGVEVRPNQRATLELADCGPKGSGGISKRLARHQRLAVDIRSGLQMVKKICEKGEELKRTRAESAAKIGDTITQLTNAAGRLHDACEEKSRRMTEANELVQWGHQMDEATAQAAATERELTVDDYGAGVSGLSKLLDKHTALEHNITEVQAARGQSLLNKAEKAQADGHFAGAQMVQEAEKLNDSLTTVLPQLAAGRREALQIMLTWRTLEKEIRAESIWLKEKLNSPLLGVAKSEKANYADTSRDLKALTELAAQVVTKDRTFKELSDRVNGLLEDKQTVSNQTRRKTVVLALGSVGDAIQSIAQLTTQKNELEEKIASIGELLLMNYTTLQLLNEIKEAEEWIRARILPVRQLAPMTDNSGTKAASQNVKNMLVDAASFNRDTIGPLTLRVQQFVAQQSSSGSTNRRAVVDAEKRTDGLPGPDLVRLMQKHAGTIESQGGKFRSRVDGLQHEAECLTSRYELLTRYLDLVGKKLQLHTEVYKFNVQADDLNRWLSEIEQTVVSNEYGSDLDECGILLSKFNEQFEASSSIGASRLSALGQKSEELIDLAAALRESLKSEEQKSVSMLAQIPDQEGWVSVPQAFQEMQDHVKMDETSTRERQEELNRKWVSIRTGMKTRKEALQSAMQIHKFMSDTEDLLEWIAAKSPQARSRNIGIALLGKLSGKTADEETRKVSSMEKARSEQEKLRHEISAMQKQMDKLDREQTRLCKEYPNRTEEVRTRWQTVQIEWNALRKSVQADQQRLSEAQMVTEWTDRCNLLISWLKERRLAILAVRVIPTELDEAKRLLNEHINIKTQLSKRNPEKDAVERSAYELTEKVPSARIVINQHCEKLATAWAHTQSVWNTRNLLYEKNLDIRKLLAEMNEIESWLEEQEARLKELNLESTESNFNVDKAIKEQDDIERAIEDSRQRVEAIKRKSAIETVGFELLKFAAARIEDGDGDSNSGIISDARVAEIQRRETTKINQSRSKNAGQVGETAAPAPKNLFATLLGGAEGDVGYGSPSVPSSSMIGQQLRQPAAETLIQPKLTTVEKSAPVTYLQDPSYGYTSDLSRVDSFGMSSPVRAMDTGRIDPVLHPSVAPATQASGKSATNAASQMAKTMESKAPSDSAGHRKLSDLFSGFRKKHKESNSRELKASEGGNKTTATLDSEPAHGGQNNEYLPSSKSTVVVPNARPAKSGPMETQGRSQHPVRSASDIDSSDEGETGEDNKYMPASLPPPSSTRAVHASVSGVSSSSNFQGTETSDRLSADVGIRVADKSGLSNEIKYTGQLTRKIVSDPKKGMNVFRKWIPTNGPGNHAVLIGPNLIFYDKQTDTSSSTRPTPTAEFDIQGGRFNKYPPSDRVTKSRRYVLKATLADKTEMKISTQTEEELDKLLQCLTDCAGTSKRDSTMPDVTSSRHGSLHRLSNRIKESRKYMSLDRKHKQ